MVGVHVVQDRGKMTGFSEYVLCFTQFVSHEACRKIFNFCLITSLYSSATKFGSLREL